MRRNWIWIAAGCCSLSILGLSAWAQLTRKPGLWEMTAVMTLQQSPFPAGMLTQNPNSPFGSAPHVTHVCLTQEQIDKYGAPMPQNSGDCKIVNVILKSSSMSAEMVCSGRMNGHATIESSWSDSTHAKGKMHFTGSMQAGPNPMPFEFTVDTTSTYQGTDCGSVKPLPTK